MYDGKYSQQQRELQFHSPLGKDVLLIMAMQGNEALSETFLYQLTLKSEQKNIKTKQLLGQHVSLHVQLANGEVREMNGIVTRFFRSGGFDTFTHYQLEMRPWLWLLSKSSDCRIFQNKTVLDIIKEIFTKPIYAGLANFDASLLRESYPQLNYCVQYRETDLNFVCRLLQKFGIYYFFRHKNGKHQLVLIDYNGAHEAIPNYENIVFATDDSRNQFGDERITLWNESGEIQTAAYTLDDFDFERVQISVNGGLQVKQRIVAHELPAYEVYDYPGTYNQAANGKHLAKVALEALHGQAEVIDGESNARGLSVGSLFHLQEHPIADQNQSYLLTGMRYALRADDYETTNASQAEIFRCEFTAIGREYRYRPAPIWRKPVVQGPQTALVVGKAGEEIWTDKYGRVKVQFHWDREGQLDEKSSCWVRVAQSWAGKRWGTMFVPRIGMEVVVEFLEGDPDQPIITGCVYNGDTMPPYDLPANQTRSTMKTHSSKEGSGFNELRFEDKKGAEEIFIHAEKDCNRVVKHNDSTQVGYGSKQPGNQSVAVKGNQSCNVGNDQQTMIGHDQTTNVGHIATLEAKTAILLKVGESVIEITPEGITINGKVLDVQGSSSAKYHGGPIVMQAPTVNIN